MRPIVHDRVIASKFRELSEEISAKDLLVLVYFLISLSYVDKNEYNPMLSDIIDRDLPIVP